MSKWMIEQICWRLWRTALGRSLFQPKHCDRQSMRQSPCTSELSAWIPSGPVHDARAAQESAPGACLCLHKLRNDLLPLQQPRDIWQLPLPALFPGPKKKIFLVCSNIFIKVCRKLPSSTSFPCNFHPQQCLRGYITHSHGVIPKNSIIFEYRKEEHLLFGHEIGCLDSLFACWMDIRSLMNLTTFIQTPRTWPSWCLSLVQNEKRRSEHEFI